MKTKIFFAGIMGAIIVHQAQAAPEVAYNYHPASPMTIGKGFSPNQPDDEKRLCLQFETHPSENQAALRTVVDAYAVHNTRDLKLALGIDTSIDAKVLVYSASGRNSFNADYFIKEESMSLVVTAKTEYGRLMLKNANYYPEFQKLLDQRKYGEFERLCGSRVVSTEYRGSNISILITIDGVSKEEQLKWMSEGSMGGAYGPVSASGKLHFEASMRRHSSNKQIKYKIFAQGGTGLDALDQLVGSLLVKSDSLDALQDALRKFVSTFKFENGAPLRFLTMPMPKYTPSESDLMSDEREEVLSEIVDKYRRAASRYQVVKSFLTPKEGEFDPRWDHFAYDRLISAKKELPVVKGYLKSIAVIHKNCLESRTDDFDLCKIPAKPYAPEYFYVDSILRYLERNASSDN